MKEIIEMLIGVYVGGVIGTLMLFAAGKIEAYTEKRRTHIRTIYKTIIKFNISVCNVWII